MFEKQMLLATLNFVLGLGIAGVSVCRLNQMEEHTPLVKVVPAALMLTAGLVSTCQPWLGHWPTESSTFVTLVVFMYVTVFRPSAQDQQPSANNEQIEL